MTTLIELIGQIDAMDAEDVIVAKPEWHRGSDARIVRLTDDYRVPEETTQLGYRYFLEVDVIRQVLGEFHGRFDVTLEEKCDRIIHYAVYDA